MCVCFPLRDRACDLIVTLVIWGKQNRRVIREKKIGLYPHKSHVLLEVVLGGILFHHLRVLVCAQHLHLLVVIETEVHALMIRFLREEVKLPSRCSSV